MEGITIKAIKLMSFVLILGMLVASGAAREGADTQPPGGGHNNDFGHYDWLNPGGVTHSYSGWNNYYPYTYPNYYYNYPTYTYPTYYYTTPTVYPTYYYNYDPWLATNVYGWGGATYHYSNSWSWNTYHP